jgi:NUMOD3 motif
MRVIFVRNKYWWWYDALITRATSRAAPIIGENHHSIPRALGGSNSIVVRLTYREHFVCHWLLTKFTFGLARKKMNYAFGMMACDGGHFDRGLSSWQYQRAKLATRTAMMGNKRTLGLKHKPEAIERMRAAKIGNQNFLGRTHTLEASVKMSAAQTGNKKWLGKKHKPETIAKMREASKRRARSAGGTWVNT